VGEQRVAVVTGAAQGIGRAIAARLAADDAAVVVVDVDERGGTAAAAAIEAAGAAARFEPADLADTDHCEQLIGRVVGTFGRIDVLVNNAAWHGQRVSFLDLTVGDWRRVVDVNLTAMALLSRDAARDMAGRGAGAIVNITSIQAQLPLATHAAYVASKGGVDALTRAMAAELSPLGIRVNAVAPGVIDTPSMDATRDAVPDRAADKNPATLLRRFGTAEEVAEAVAFLASERAAFITGATLRVDGGRILSRFPDPLAAVDTAASKRGN
jgi:NAD(P)-dependent dehydrogenase (short-subunit alcohol dehydrogenase family)